MNKHENFSTHAFLFLGTQASLLWANHQILTKLLVSKRMRKNRHKSTVLVTVFFRATIPTPMPPMPPRPSTSKLPLISSPKIHHQSQTLLRLRRIALNRLPYCRKRRCLRYLTVRFRQGASRRRVSVSIKGGACHCTRCGGRDASWRILWCTAARTRRPPRDPILQRPLWWRHRVASMTTRFVKYDCQYLTFTIIHRILNIFIDSFSWQPAWLQRRSSSGRWSRWQSTRSRSSRTVRVRCPSWPCRWTWKPHRGVPSTVHPQRCLASVLCRPKWCRRWTAWRIFSSPNVARPPRLGSRMRSDRRMRQKHRNAGVPVSDYFWKYLFH